MSKFLTKRNLFWFFAIIITVFALFLRINYYCFNYSFCGDEANLVIPLILHSFKNILFSYENLGELAPPLFFFAEKIVTNMFGISEYSVRIIPLISSLFSCVMFLFFADKMLDNNRAKLLSLSLFAISSPLVIMAGFYKPYSTEVVFALLILYFFGLKFSFKNKSIAVCSLVALIHVLCFLTSFQSVFIIFSCLAVHFIYTLIFERDKNVICKILGVTFVDLICLGLYYHFFLRKMRENSLLNYMWANDYSFFPLAHRDIGNLTDFLFGHGSYWNVAPKALIVVVLSMLFVGLVAFIVDLFVKKSAEAVYKFLLVVVPIASMMLAGILNIYPFANRLVLSLLPLMLIIVSKPIDFKKKYLSAILTVVWLIVIGYYLQVSDLKNGRFHEIFDFNEPCFDRYIYQQLKEINEPEKAVYIEVGAFMTGFVYNYMYHYGDNVLSSDGSYLNISSFKNTDEFIDKIKNEKEIYFVYESLLTDENIDSFTKEKRDVVYRYFNCEDISTPERMYMLSKCIAK